MKGKNVFHNKFERLGRFVPITPPTYASIFKTIHTYKKVRVCILWLIQTNAIYWNLILAYNPAENHIRGKGRKEEKIENGERDWRD